MLQTPGYEPVKGEGKRFSSFTLSLDKDFLTTFNNIMHNFFFSNKVLRGLGHPQCTGQGEPVGFLSRGVLCSIGYHVSSVRQMPMQGLVSWGLAARNLRTAINKLTVFDLVKFSFFLIHLKNNKTSKKMVKHLCNLNYFCKNNN